MECELPRKPIVDGVLLYGPQRYLILQWHIPIVARDVLVFNTSNAKFRVVSRMTSHRLRLFRN